jgi:molybdopterin converting factor small subunit
MATIRIPAPLRKLTNNQEEVPATGTSLGSILDELNKTYPGFGERILDEQFSSWKHHLFRFILNPKPRVVGIHIYERRHHQHEHLEPHPTRETHQPSATAGFCFRGGGVSFPG